MADEKGKLASSPGKTGSTGSQAGHGGETAQLVDLLTKVLQSVQEQVKSETKPALEGKAYEAVEEYKNISKALRVPTQLNSNIDDPKWQLPPVNPRARAKEQE